MSENLKNKLKTHTRDKKLKVETMFSFYKHSIAVKPRLIFQIWFKWFFWWLEMMIWFSFQNFYMRVVKNYNNEFGGDGDSDATILKR